MALISFFIKCSYAAPGQNKCKAGPPKLEADFLFVQYIYTHNRDWFASVDLYSKMQGTAMESIWKWKVLSNIFCHDKMVLKLFLLMMITIASIVCDEINGKSYLKLPEQ